MFYAYTLLKEFYEELDPTYEELDPTYEEVITKKSILQEFIKYEPIDSVYALSGSVE